MSNLIFLDAPDLGLTEKEYLNKAIDDGYVSTAGPFIEIFEKKFMEFIGTSKAVSVQSGTAALHLALYESGIGPGDEVIVPNLTFIATVTPIKYVGAKPVFVDVNPNTWNIDANLIESKINPKTKAIIPVHLYGNTCDMTKIMELKEKYNLIVIEDATESLGSKHNGKYTGTIGDYGCFSFNGNKLITTGGGGIIVGKNSKKLDHIRFLANQARDMKKGYFHPEIGFNYRMTNIEAALGIAQIGRINEFIEKKRQFHRLYNEYLSDCEEIEIQIPEINSEPLFWITAIRFKKNVNVDDIVQKLRKNNIQTRKMFLPLTKQPPFYEDEVYRVSEKIYNTAICLPSSVLNSAKDIKKVCIKLKEIIKYEI